jgi:shikimate kinase
MTVTLIGMPAAGKSAMSRALSRKLGLELIECDKLIEEKAGQKLQDIINENGLEYFKKLEEEVLCSISTDNAVISTGGSAVYYDSAMRHFKSLGKVLYLYADLPTIIDRLGDFSKRGIVLKDGQTIVDLYEERCALYKMYADYTIDCSGSSYVEHKNSIIRVVKRWVDKEKSN